MQVITCLIIGKPYLACQDCSTIATALTAATQLAWRVAWRSCYGKFCCGRIRDGLRNRRSPLLKGIGQVTGRGQKKHEILSGVSSSAAVRRRNELVPSGQGSLVLGHPAY
jgi:hypothetical protein